MSANFTPEMLGYTGQGPFRYWCQKVLPLVYDDSLSYLEVLHKVTTYLNNTISDVANVETNVDNLATAFNNLQGYVNEHIDAVELDVAQFEEYVTNYLTNLNVQDEINNKLDAMATSGSLGGLLLGEIYDPNDPDNSLISQLVSDWLNDTITGPAPGEAVIVDSTLSISGAAADAKVTGDKINYTQNTIEGALGHSIFKGTPVLYMANNYINNSGVVSSNSNFDIFGPITIPAKSTLTVKAQGYATNVAVVASVSDGETPVYTSLVRSADSTEREYTYNANEEIKVVISTNKSTTPIYSLSYPSVENKFEQLTSDVGRIVNDANYYPWTASNFENGTILKGVFNPDIKYRVSSPNIIKTSIPIKLTIEEGFQINVMYYVNNNYSYTVDSDITDTYTIKSYSQFKIVIRRVTENTSEIADVNDFVSKIKANGVIANVATDVNELKNKLITIPWEYAIDKVLCIGDSLTKGSPADSQTMPSPLKENYPYFLERMINTECTNTGVPGIAATGWYKYEYRDYTMTDYNAFIIFLGTNGGLTDTLNTDVDPYNDYNNFADTNTGNYCKIISHILADKNNNALIVLVNTWYNGTGQDTTRIVIDKIGEKYGLPVIETVDIMPYSVNPSYHGNIDNVHCSKAGYLALASLICNGIRKYINEHPDFANKSMTQGS